jgi:hypothetical protein
MPLVLAALALDRRWRALASFAALGTALSLAVMPLLGTGWPLGYARLLLNVAGWDRSGVINPRIMHNWRGLATNLATAAHWPPALATALYVGLTVGSLALVGSVWWRRRQFVARPAAATHDASRRGSDYAWALTGLVAVLASPHLNPHDLALLLFPAWIVGVYATSGNWSAGWSRLWLGLLWTAYVLPLSLYVGENPALAVVPSVLLLATASTLLAWRA